jgi:hypothetical protein
MPASLIVSRTLVVRPFARQLWEKFDRLHTPLTSIPPLSGPLLYGSRTFLYGLPAVLLAPRGMLLVCIATTAAQVRPLQRSRTSA